MRIAFEDFELDTDHCELTRGGRHVLLERRPTEVLCLLASRPGTLIGRRELANHIWGAASGVDVDMGLNTAIRKIRAALGDTAEQPRFIETVQGRGYRFNSPAPATGMHTLAVLPFDRLGGLSDDTYLADGFTEETIAALGALEPAALRVLGRRTILQSRGLALGLAELGVKFGAAYLLESGLQRQGETLRITTRLIHAPDERQLWSASFDGQSTHLLELQRVVSRAIADAVRSQLALSAPTPRAERHTRDEAAFALYLRGRHCWNSNQSGGTQEAIGYLTRATECAPDYALAWSGLADAYSVSPVNSDMPALRVWLPARAAAEAALRTGPDLAEAAASMGFVRFWLDWDWQDALRLFQRSASLDPGYAFAHRMVGIASSHLGLHEPAAAAIRRAVELDPLFAMHHALSAVVAYHAHHFQQAASFARDAIDVDPTFWIGHLQRAQAMEELGEYPAALEAADAAARTCGNSSKPAMLRGYILARAGRQDDARAVLHDLHHLAKQRFVPPYATALIHLGLGETEAALAGLRQGLAERDVNLAFLPADPKWRRLRGDPRFAAILQECAFTHSSEAVPTEFNLHTAFSSAPWSAGRPPH